MPDSNAALSPTTNPLFAPPRGVASLLRSVGLLTLGLCVSATAAAQEAQPAQEAPATPAASPSGEEPPKSELKAPELEHYEPPIYPKEAFAQGIEAQVQVKITVQVDGTVTDPEVVAPQGNGFDEAALAAAFQLKFKPATLDGEPRAVRIGFQYNFTIDEEVKEVPAEETPQVGELGGLVLLSDTETALPGVEIIVVDALGNEYPATTDLEGRWRLEAMAPGVYELKIRSEGFLPVDSKETVIVGEATELTFRLSADSGELEVVIEGERPAREVTRRTLERREIQKIPGSSGDALRSIQSLPGVARPPGLAGLLIVRGSAPEDTGTFIDGAEVPLIYHFGGLSSVVPTEMLDKIDFYPGNYSVRYGRYMGGIVDVDLRKPNTDCYGDYGATVDEGRCYHGMAQVDFIDGRLMFQGPVPGTDDWSFALAGRRSWVDVLVKPALEAAGTVSSAPVYYDYQAIVERNVGDNDKLSFRFFGSDDGLELILANPAAQDPGFGGNLAFGTAFTRGQILYQKALTRKTNLDTSLTIGTQKIDFSLGGNLKFVLDSIPVDLRSEIGHRFHDTAKLNVGFDFVTGPYDVFVRAPPIPVEGQAATPPLATAVPLETSASGYSFRPAWYGDVEWEPAPRWRFVPGIRFDYARDSGRADISPRLTARYDIILPEDEFWGDQLLGTTLKGGVGKFSQPPQFQETDAVFGTPGLDSNQSMHYSLGVEQDLTEQIELSIEGYYKDYYNQVSSRPTGAGQLYENEGSGRVIGMETLLKYKPDARFFGWVAYTLSQSLRRECPTCELRSFAYDQTHNLIMLGSYRLGRGWEFGARFRIVSGPLTTPVSNDLPAIYAGDAGTYLPIQGTPNSERLPLFHQLDMRVDKRWVFRTWQLSAYLDVQNLYNNAAAEAYVYNFNYSQKAYQTGLPVIPSLGVRGEF